MNNQSIGLKSRLTRLRNSPLFSTGLALLVLIVVQFITIVVNSPDVWVAKWTTNWLNILLNNSYVGIIALGMTLVIISGGIDLAVGSTVVGVGAITMVLINVKENGVLAQMGVTGAPAILIGVLAGLLLGLALGEINGLIVTLGRVPPFIATLGMMKITRSVTQYYMQTQKGVTLPEEFKMISKLNIGGNMLMPIFYWAVLAVLLWFIAKHTAFGRHVYAVGSNERTARLSGVKIDHVKRRVYALMGLITAFAAIIQIARTGSMDYASSGSGYEMDAIAAVIIGGTAMSGGKGSIPGTIIGMLILAVLNNLLTLWQVDAFLRNAFQGAIVVAAVLLQRKNNRSNG